MLAIRIALLAWLGIGLLYWLYQLYAVVRSIRATPRLRDIAPPEPRTWPRVSAILTAQRGRNHGARYPHPDGRRLP